MRPFPTPTAGGPNRPGQVHRRVVQVVVAEVHGAQRVAVCHGAEGGLQPLGAEVVVGQVERGEVLRLVALSLGPAMRNNEYGRNIVFFFAFLFCLFPH